jgi:Ni/Co efflux regulator RcnB
MTIVPRTRLITIAAATVALAAGLAPAQAAPATAGRTGANVQGQNQSADPSRRICVSAEVTGTRMTRRVCRTAAEWERAGGIPGRD